MISNVVPILNTLPMHKCKLLNNKNVILSLEYSKIALV
jgi:hypothetical protein